MTLADTYDGCRVLVTGHTGFKGSWLVTWLLKLGADVVGVSRDVPTRPAMFEVLDLAGRIKDMRADIRDLDTLRDIIFSERPDFIFHLAAQSIVSMSYEDPVETVTTNTVGTMNVLESLRALTQPCAAVLITSDKCYDNVEWEWGYRENDRLGGKDVYSGSKGAAELVIRSYMHSFFGDDQPIRIAVGRAGNVIGGGDWAKDRLIVDCIKAWSQGRTVEIRSPHSTRPWQHVLEPLSGYLTLGQAISRQGQLHGQAFNFGPGTGQIRTVIEIIEDLSRHWQAGGSAASHQVADEIPFHEAGLLKLNCDKALFYLKWESNLNHDETIRMVGDWYRMFYEEKADVYELTMDQIDEYERLGAERGRVWAKA